MKHTETHAIGELLRQFIREEGLETPLNQHRLIQAWPEVVGPVVSKYTQELFIRNQTLFVKISSSTLRGELSYARKTLVQRLNEKVGAQVIADVHLY